jgi:hypothetical protein
VSPTGDDGAFCSFLVPETNMRAGVAAIGLPRTQAIDVGLDTYFIDEPDPWQRPAASIRRDHECTIHRGELVALLLQCNQDRSQRAALLGEPVERAPSCRCGS